MRTSAVTPYMCNNIRFGRFPRETVKNAVWECCKHWLSLEDFQTLVDHKNVFIARDGKRFFYSFFEEVPKETRDLVKKVCACCNGEIEVKPLEQVEATQKAISLTT